MWLFMFLNILGLDMICVFFFLDGFGLILFFVIFLMFLIIMLFLIDLFDDEDLVDNIRLILFEDFVELFCCCIWCCVVVFCWCIWCCVVLLDLGLIGCVVLLVCDDVFFDFVVDEVKFCLVMFDVIMMLFWLLFLVFGVVEVGVDELYFIIIVYL